jgi:hypothetical protein
MSHAIIRQIYEARLKTWAEARVPALRIAYENVAFTPVNAETYLKAFTLPANTDSQTLAGDHRGYIGVFQVSIITPAGAGTGKAGGIAGEIADLFPVDLRLTKSGLEVLVLTPVDPGPGITQDSTYTVAASFQYRSDTN